mmetsp:Transcript_81106/g.241669  ORF Transcript_81106/g.241669 Transcript_81106/m.241669 type:complete len:207 (-) Transcript_81106:131-751(-)
MTPRPKCRLNFRPSSRLMVLPPTTYVVPAPLSTHSPCISCSPARHISRSRCPRPGPGRERLLESESGPSGGGPRRRGGRRIPERGLDEHGLLGGLPRPGPSPSRQPPSREPSGPCQPRSRWGVPPLEARQCHLEPSGVPSRLSVPPRGRRSGGRLPASSSMTRRRRGGRPPSAKRPTSSLLRRGSGGGPSVGDRDWEYPDPRGGRP